MDNGAKRAAVGEGRTPKTTEVLVDLTSDSEDELPLKRKVPQPKSSPAASMESVSKSEDNYSTSNGNFFLFSFTLYPCISRDRCKD